MFEPNNATIIGSFTNNACICINQPNFVSGVDNAGGSSGGILVSPGVNIQNNWLDINGGNSSAFRLTSLGSTSFAQINQNTNMRTGLKDASGGFAHYP